MKITPKQQGYIYEHFVYGFARVDERGVSGYLTYRQMVKIVKYLEKEEEVCG